MNDESQILQRDQMKKPSLQRYVNGNLSSPFPFMEFGLNAGSSLSNILNTFPRENDFIKKIPLSRLDNHNQEDSITDPYLKPLNLERLKSAISNGEHNALPNFIRSTNGNISNNDFSTNVFLRYQSARSDIVNKELNANKGFQTNTPNKILFKSNGTILQNRDQRPNTAVLPLKMRGILSDEDQDQRTLNNSDLSFGRPTTASVQLKPLNGSSMPVVGTQTGTKFYLKSFKTDALIYNSHDKLFTQESAKEMSSEKMSDNVDSKNSNTQSLYLQVKNEVAEYRKQRLKEASIDIDNIPQLKLVSVDDISPPNIDIRGTEKLTKRLTESSNVTNNEGIKVTEKKEYSEEYGCDDNSLENRTMRRSKSVTFSDIVETREILDEPQSDFERSCSPDDSESSSSSENESQGSVVSTDSESDDDTSKGSLTESSNTKNHLPIKSVKKISLENEDSDNSKESLIKNNESDSEEEETRNRTNVDHCKGDNVPVTNKSSSSPDRLSNGTKSSITSDCQTESKSSSTNSTTNSVIQSRPPSATLKSRVIPERPTKKGDLKSKFKSIMCQQDLLDLKAFKETELNMPLIFSKFPFVPPVVNFVGEGEKVEQLPWQLRKLLRWRTSLLTPVIVKQIITRSGFRPSRLTTATDDLDSVETSDWILYFGKHMKGPVFKTLKEYQKVNHFPGSFQLGRKDRLWRNICKMQQEVGKKEFDFIPQTFCLPTDLELLKQCWESGGNKHKWIIKPPASARGIGIKVVYKWNQIPKRRPVVVQRYISNPYLINDSKFDLRLYVFLASIDPLRIYLYEDGLVRFASIKYTNSVKSIHNRFIHLTNYSVNRLNIEYLDNNDNEACKGHKWSLKALWTYLRKRGVNTDIVWDRIKDLVVKTVISAEEMIGASVKAYCASPYNVKELFGFDVLLDENLKPWILEVNVSPSLHSDTPLDVAVKSGMIKDVLNLSGFMLPELADIDPPINASSKPPSDRQTPSSDLHIDLRLWLYNPSDDEIAKAKHFVYLAANGQPGQRFDLNDTLPYQMLDCLTPNDVRCLVDSYDEYERKGNFQRVYPVTSTNLVKKYLSCCEGIRYFNLLLATFITKYHRNGQDVRLLEKLCQRKLHLLSSELGDKIDPKHVWHPTNFSGDK